MPDAIRFAAVEVRFAERGLKWSFERRFSNIARATLLDQRDPVFREVVVGAVFVPTSALPPNNRIGKYSAIGCSSTFSSRRHKRNA